MYKEAHLLVQNLSLFFSFFMAGVTGYLFFFMAGVTGCFFYIISGDLH